MEKVLLENPSVADVAVLGSSDAVWGQVVSAVVVPAKPGSDIQLQEVDQCYCCYTTITIALTFDYLKQLQNWCESRLPPYSLPRRLKLLPELPRNQMGKVNKKELVQIAFPQPES